VWALSYPTWLPLEPSARPDLAIEDSTRTPSPTKWPDLAIGDSAIGTICEIGASWVTRAGRPAGILEARRGFVGIAAMGAHCLL